MNSRPHSSIALDDTMTHFTAKSTSHRLPEKEKTHLTAKSTSHRLPEKEKTDMPAFDPSILRLMHPNSDQTTIDQARLADLFEPIPLVERRTDQQSATLQAMLEESIRFLFHHQEGPRRLLSTSMLASTSACGNNTTQGQPRQEQDDPPIAKRQRHDLFQARDECLAIRFRPSNTEQWDSKFEMLLRFRKQHGHCSVPHTYPENPILARWVKRQRYQYKLKNGGEASTVTDGRIKTLERVGFVWDAHNVAWEVHLSHLMKYRDEYGHCNVPGTDLAPNKQLGTWVKCQRRQYKLLRDGKPSTMTIDRMNTLDRMGFTWELRSVRRKISERSDHPSIDSMDRL
jgi:hypothetical protein